VSYDVLTQSCLTGCEVIPDPNVYTNIPFLDLSLVSLDITGIFSTGFTYDSVQSRQITLSDIKGPDTCQNLLPWEENTINNTCATELASKWHW
jgi:hypothetical protein